MRLLRIPVRQAFRTSSYPKRQIICFLSTILILILVCTMYCSVIRLPHSNRGVRFSFFIFIWYNYRSDAQPRGILLHGPPGCGKTLLANAIAGELGVAFLRISAPEIVSGMSGESEQKVRKGSAGISLERPRVLLIRSRSRISPPPPTIKYTWMFLKPGTRFVYSFFCVISLGPLYLLVYYSCSKQFHLLPLFCFSFSF